ncbi:MAG: nickel-dependent lactate racemase [Phycisphaerae bacterium]|nr:nickel-dependent lactate racemase [Phycisphaerae bacterium]
MSKTQTIKMLYGKGGLTVTVPAEAVVLEGKAVPALADPAGAVRRALAKPIGCKGLAEIVAARRPRTVAITISDITRPVPNKEFLPAMLEALNAAGVADGQIVVIIGTGLHRPSTPQERQIILGDELLGRLEVIDHRAEDASTLVTVSDSPPVSVCRRFAQADLRIVTGYIEPHFMAGFSGGRKGVCPALVDLATLQRFHGYKTLADPKADNGILDGNPCHEIALGVARAVGVGFLFNVAITRDRRVAGVYCGDLVKAHLAGCREVVQWTSAMIQRPFDLVVTNGGGFPLDQTFYQTGKGMCTALPALGENSTLLIASHCGEQLGSPAFTELMLRYDNDWRRFLADIAASDETKLDQWGYQMHAKVLARIGQERLWFVSDGIPAEMQHHITVTPILGEGDAQQRTQRAIDEFVSAHPKARVAIIPDGPYTMLKTR